MKRNILISAVILVFAACLFGALGGIPFEVLDKTIGARALSMGEACVADPSGISTIFWNPAALDSSNKNVIYGGAELLYEGAHMEYISYATPMGKYGSLGLMAGYLGYGSYEVVNSSSEVTGNADLKDIFLTAAYGKNIIGGYEAGLALKMLVRAAADGTYPAFNADISFHKSFDRVDLGVAFKNVLPTDIKYSVDSEKFVSSMRIGASLKLLDSSLKIAADMEKYFIQENPVFFVGAEYMLFDMLALRAGFNTFSEISGGLGINFQNLSLDYAVTFSDAVLMHKIALSCAFGGYEVALKAEPEVFSPVGAIKKTYIRIKAATKYEIYKWSLELKDKKGDTVRIWNGAGAPDVEVIWDGLRQDGMPYEEGIYKAVLTVIDENDNSLKSKEIDIKIQTNDARSIPMFGE